MSKMKLRARTKRSYVNTTQWVDSQSEGTESSDEPWLTILNDRANPTEDEIETSKQIAARRAKAAESQKRRRSPARHAKENQIRKRKEMRLARCNADPLNSSMWADNLKRLEGLRRMREARRLETPEQTAARRAKANECQHRRRERLRAARKAETPEQTVARLAKKAQLRQAETPQQAAKRRASKSKSDKRRREKRALERLQGLGVMETPEEAETRRAKERERRRGNALARANAKERRRQRNKLLKETESPEEAEIRRARERKKRHENAIVYANVLERQRNRRRLLKESETPELAAARRAKAKELRKRKREQIEAARKADEPACTCEKKERIKVTDESLSENAESEQYDINDDLNSSSTCSFERPEEISSIISIEDEPTVQQQCLEEPLISISELGQDPWSCFDDMTIYNEQSFIDVSQDLYIKPSEDKKQEAMATNLSWFSNPLDANIGRDEHIVYCEHIAEKFRKCNRSVIEIKVAKDIIEDIMLNLSTGAYRSMTSAFSNKQEVINFRPAIIEPIVQEIIVKEEVHL